MSLSLLIFWLIVSGFCILLYNFICRNNSSITRRELPVVSGLPLFGYLLNFRDRHYQEKLSQIRATYGDVCKVKLGSYECIWLNNYKIIREAWKNPSFCGRPKLPGITDRTHGFTGGIIFNDGEGFDEQRRFTVSQLKNLGLGKLSMENIIQEEIDKVLEIIESHNGEPIPTNHLFNMASLNILWAIISGERYEYKDKNLIRLMDTLQRNMMLKDRAILGFFMPWLSKYFPKLVGWNQYLRDSQEVFEFWNDYAKERIHLFHFFQEIEDIPKNFVNFYINKIMKTEDESSSFYGATGELSLATTLQDLFIAGTETTATTLSWILLFSAAFQNCQDKVYEEISKIVGRNVSQKATLMDRRRMPYTEAFIQESMRFVTLAPLGMIHCTTEESSLAGFLIPKGTLIHANICGAHHDKSVWDNPESFSPERFLSNDKIKQEAFLAFSAGKRRCPGEAFARNELFLFLTRLIQLFEVTGSPCIFKDDLLPRMGISATPKQHYLEFKKRSNQE